MSDSKRINELYLKIAGLERRISKLEYGTQELDSVVDPQGWISEAFERVEENISELRTEIDKANGKLDIILQHITGMSGLTHPKDPNTL